MATQAVCIMSNCYQNLKLWTLLIAALFKYRSALAINESIVMIVVLVRMNCATITRSITVMHSQIRCWTIPAGATAPEAAGAIHSDFERGFIKAEVGYCLYEFLNNMGK